MTLPRLLAANATVIWTWGACVVVVFAVQLAAGLSWPSQGLALSVSALPAAVVAAAPPRVRRWVMLATVTVVGLVALADAAHHRVFGTYLPPRSFLAVDQAWAVRGYATRALGWGGGTTVLVILLTAAAALRGLGSPRAVAARWHTALPLAACLAGGVPAFAWAWVVAPGDADQDTGGFLHAHLVDARRVLGEGRMDREPTPGEVARVMAFTSRAGGGADGADPWRGAFAGASVLLIQVEALSAWLLDATVGGEPVMPFLRSLADGGLAFTSVFDETHEGRSSDSDYLVMASQHPLERDAVSMVRPSLDPVALPDVLRSHGYATFSAHAHTPGFWNAAIRHRMYGFEESLFEADLGDGERFGFGLVDRVFFERVAPRLERLPHPWLAWLITLTMHEPDGEVPPSFRTLPLGDLEGTPLGNYFLKARHTDDALRALLAGLEASGTLERTMVVVYGDHTDVGGVGMTRVQDRSGALAAEDARQLLRDRVALLLVPPRGGGGSAAVQGARLATVGGLIDVAPTVLGLLGIEPPRSYLGRSLTAPGPSTAAQATGEVVGDSLMWTGSGCYAFPDAQPRPAGACDALRAAAREELEVSWIITRRALSARLDAAR